LDFETTFFGFILPGRDSSTLTFTCFTFPAALFANSSSRAWWLMYSLGAVKMEIQEIFRFSRLFNEMFDDARVAIESGKSQEKCAYLYDTCDFSLNNMMSKYMDYNDISSNPDQDVEYLKK